jgi:hypothetical protein
VNSRLVRLVNLRLAISRCALPALAVGHEGLESGRGGASTAGRLRSSLARSKRRPGIDYDGLPASLAAHAVEPGDAGYARYTSSYLRGGAPGLVLRPQTAEEVRDAA